MFARFFSALIALLLIAMPASARLDETGRWPADGPSGSRVAVKSASPFALYDAARGDAPATDADVTFTKAVGASAARPARLSLRHALVAARRRIAPPAASHPHRRASWLGLGFGLRFGLGLGLRLG